ncbi:MAG: tyrosine-protein phosphatase [Lachnospiraceae bacterium]|nr:tyrosine-protein phosphatase [Lachnospiraceae bacterium]
MKKLITAMLCLMIAVCGCGAGQSGADGIGTAQNTEQASAGQSTEQVSEQSVPEVEAGISKIDKYGNIFLTIGAEAMEDLGYETADIIRVRIKDIESEMPIGTSYTDADSGEPVCCFTRPASGPRSVALVINSGSMAEVMGIARKQPIDEEPGYEWQFADGFDETAAVFVSMVQKQGYAEEYRMHQIGGVRSNKRSDYADLSDEEFANFRAVTTTGMGCGALFRSSSPINPALGRNDEADTALLDSMVRTVMNMADSETVMRRYADYSLTSYAGCDIIALDMSMDLSSEDFRQKLARGFSFLTSHEGPYLIHCNEGKDRTGYAAAILECLMGADAEEVIEDYMLTYRNFYGIEPGSEQYEEIADKNIAANLEKTFRISSIRDKDADLQGCAEAYLKEIGLSGEEISALKERLSRSY